MAKGKQGFALEAWKFGVYLVIPIVASFYFADPLRQKEQADYWQYVKYPANPNINMKAQIEEMAKQEKQRKVYREQLLELNKQAQRTNADQQQDESPSSGEGQQEGRRGWLRWIGLGSRSPQTK